MADDRPGAPIGPLVRTAAFVVLVPCSVAGWIPAAILRSTGGAWPAAVGVREVVAVAFLLAGVAIALPSIVDFAVTGLGTPAPIDPPKVLVVRGHYRWTRNPMYVGIVTILLAEALFFGSPALAKYAIGLFVMFHLFVVVYEEPTLARLFGEAYAAYRATVPRWIGLPRRAAQSPVRRVA